MASHKSAPQMEQPPQWCSLIRWHDYLTAGKRFEPPREAHTVHLGHLMSEYQRPRRTREPSAPPALPARSGEALCLAYVWGPADTCFSATMISGRSRPHGGASGFLAYGCYRVVGIVMPQHPSPHTVSRLCSTSTVSPRGRCRPQQRRQADRRRADRLSEARGARVRCPPHRSKGLPPNACALVIPLYFTS